MGLDRYAEGAFARGFPRPWGKRRPPRVAFVLSGGGVLGAVQVGQLQALFEAGIVPDLIVAASVGAINGATVACTPTPAGVAELRAVWSRLKSEDIFPGSRLQRAVHFVRKGDHLYANSGIRRLVDMMPVRSFEATRIPCHVVASNLRSGKEHWFSEGLLAPAILASTAIPSIFPPVLVDGELYVDGGLVNNVPISRAVSLGATHIFVLTCGAAQQDARPIRRPLDVLLQAVAHSRAAKVDVDVAHYGTSSTIEVLPVPETGWIRFNDTSRSVHLIQAAYEAARAHLESARKPAGVP